MVVVIGPKAPPMGGVVRFAESRLELAPRLGSVLELFPDNVPDHWRPNTKVVGERWNILARDGVMATAKTMAFVFHRFGALYCRLTRSRVDVVHVLSSAGYGFLRNAGHLAIARWCDSKTVFHVLGQVDVMHAGAGPGMRRLMRFTLDLSDVVVVQSEGLARQVRQMTRRPVVGVLNPVTVGIQRSAPSGRTIDEVRVCSVAVMSVRKNTDLLISVASSICRVRPNARFLLAGAGDVGFYRAMATQLCPDGRVEVMGPISDAEMSALLTSSDLFVLPSKAEGLPIALLEAMVAGLPVVSTPVGAIPEVVGPGNGVLVPVDDATSLTTALLALIDDPERRQSIAATNRVDAARLFSPDAFATAVRRIYADLDPPARR